MAGDFAGIFFGDYERRFFGMLLYFRIDVFEYAARCRGVQLFFQPAQRDSNDVAVMQFRPVGSAA
jgi:hypothetical protein